MNDNVSSGWSPRVSVGVNDRLVISNVTDGNGVD